MKMVKYCGFIFQLCLWLSLSLSMSYATPAIYIFLGGERANQYESYLQNPNIKGAQIIYSWKILEPEKGRYDFSSIEADLRFLNTMNKELFIQIQDKSFHPNVINVPPYLLSEKYKGGIAKQMDFPGEGKPLSAGWVAKQWVPDVRKRFQKLMARLAKKFDGKIKGINLTETSIDLDKRMPPSDFTCDKYFNAIIENIGALRSVFHKSDVVQYVNFFPCEWNNDHRYMSRLFAYAQKHRIGLGGPDTVPYRRGQMKNSYPFFSDYKGKLPLITFAIQEPDYTYQNPKTKNQFTAEELYAFAKNYLGASIIFWNVKQPQYDQHVIPLLARIQFEGTDTQRAQVK